MIRMASYWLLASLLISGCATVNRNPDILLQAPYTRINYIAKVTKEYRPVEMIQVETRGHQANILNTIPRLYKKVLAYSENRAVTIGHLTISSYTKQETFQVPYQDCTSLPQTRSVPRTSCYQGGCRITYSTQTRFIRQCTTRYRTELRNVLYQIASVDVLIKNQVL